MDLFQNVLLFVPLGLVMRARGWSPGTALMAGGCLSGAVEALQMAVPGRYAAAIDVATNVGGAALGFAMATVGRPPWGERVLRLIERAIERVFGPGRVLRKAAPLITAAAAALVMWFTVYLLAPIADVRYVVPGRELDLPAGPLRIGSDANGGFFPGVIDEVRVYSRPRPADLIRADMDRPVRADTISSDLVAAFGFDEPRDPAFQAAAGGHGPTWVQGGRHGAAISFDAMGNAPVAALEPAPRLRDGMTLEAWVLPRGPVPPRPTTIVDGGGVYFLAAALHGTDWTGAVGGLYSQMDEHLDFPSRLPADTWTHLAGTYDGEVLRLYVNGRLAAAERWWAPHRAEDVSLNGAAVPLGVQPSPGVISAAIAGDLLLRFRLHCGRREAERGPVFHFIGSRNLDAFGVLAEGNDLVVTWNTVPRRNTWPSPSHRFAGALSSCASGESELLEITGSVLNPVLRLDGRMLAGERPGLAAGWAFLVPSELILPVLRRMTTVLWLLAMLFPFGLSAGKDAATAAGVVVVVATVVLAPIVSGVRPLDTLEIMSAGGAILAGTTSRRMAARMTR
jgi:hypothetical protein